MYIDQNVDPTKSYLIENEYINSLKRITLPFPKKKKNTNNFAYKFLKLSYRFFKNIYSYLAEDIIINRNYFFYLVKLRNTKKPNNALVIGNGPSQGYLSIDYLEKFRSLGGEIFVVNFWHENERLSKFIPNYIVISDPITLSFDHPPGIILEKNKAMLDYLKKNKEIKIFAPLNRVAELELLFGLNRVFGFVDIELRGLTNNIHPIFPRGYLSMTLFKALALSIWFGYKEIFVIGMDNTYPRNIYCDKNNKILNLEIHAGVDNFVADQTPLYSSMGDIMQSITNLFMDSYKFKKATNVKNIDQYSLTDAFKKVEFEYPISLGKKPTI